LTDEHLVGLIDSNLQTLHTAAQLLKTLKNDQYSHIQRPHFESSLGKHLRHILDHYLCFRRDFAKGIIDYDQRQRDCQLEIDKDYALCVIQQIVHFLEGLKQHASARQCLRVLMCNDVDVPEGEITESSLGRELQFLQGHSVHHYALMAAILRISGHAVGHDFGVAPSTLVHEKTVKESA
jgi:uncharacterized damage-inducible protein DinB